MTEISNTPKYIGSALALASCAALGIAAPMVQAQGEPDTWDFHLAGLYYGESDSRVMAIEPVFSATRNYAEGETLTLKGVFDVLTGASPNGATPSDGVQTFTRPSGNGQYDVAAGSDPLDDTFKDTRVALSADWAAALNRDWDYSAGVYGSREYDYMSFGMSGGMKRYLNNKNTTLNVGLSLSHDLIDPVGNSPRGLSAMPHQNSPTYDADRATSRDDGAQTKDIIDLLLGVTQVIDRSTIMQFNYALSLADGYLNDPYKMLSVIDESAGLNYGGNLLDGNANPIYLYEQRPDRRMKHALFWQTKHALDGGDVLDVSYRFMFDDWGITSHTFDLAYRWNFGGAYLEPHVRYYLQSEADFYKRFLTEAEYNGAAPTLKEASPDYRLGELDAITLGAKFGWKTARDNEFSVRLEYYMQGASGDQGFGKLTAQELYPDTDALMVTVGYKF
jgi:hypothetical protein